MRLTLSAQRRRRLRELHRLAPIYNAKIGVFLALWAAASALALASRHLAIRVAADAAAGLAIHGLIVLMHDAAHGLLSRRPAVNRWLGFVCGLPFWASVTAYRCNHTTHHRVTGTDEDPGDLVGAARRAGISMRHVVLVVLSLATLLVIPSIARDGFRKAPPGQRRQVLVEYALIAAAFALFFALAPWRVILHVWLAPFAVLSLVNNARSLAEHTFTDRGDPLGNTRSVESCALVRFLFSNVNLHWEHHRFPRVPWYRLPELRALLAEEVAAPAAARESGYARWLWRDVLPRLRRADCAPPRQGA